MASLCERIEELSQRMESLKEAFADAEGEGGDLTVKEVADTLGIKPREDAKKYPARAIPALVETLVLGEIAMWWGR